MKNKKILITAGATREFLDPVRYMSNPSSGRMGIKVAEKCREKGGRVVLVLGPTWLKPPKNVKTINVVSALDMERAVKKEIANCNAFIATAAVGDYRFEKIHSQKFKKKNSKRLTLRLIKNPDILSMVGQQKKKHQILIGFALETGNSLKNAVTKLLQKNLDVIIANDPSSFSNSQIKPLWIESTGRIESGSSQSKDELAAKISNWLESQWKKTI